MHALDFFYFETVSSSHDRTRSIDNYYKFLIGNIMKYVVPLTFCYEIGDIL